MEKKKVRPKNRLDVIKFIERIKKLDAELTKFRGKQLETPNYCNDKSKVDKSNKKNCQTYLSFVINRVNLESQGKKFLEGESAIFYKGIIDKYKKLIETEKKKNKPKPKPKKVPTVGKTNPTGKVNNKGRKLDKDHADNLKMGSVTYHKCCRDNKCGKKYNIK